MSCDERVAREIERTRHGDQPLAALEADQVRVGHRARAQPQPLSRRVEQGTPELHLELARVLRQFELHHWAAAALADLARHAEQIEQRVRTAELGFHDQVPAAARPGVELLQAVRVERARRRGTISTRAQAGRAPPPSGSRAPQAHAGGEALGGEELAQPGLARHADVLRHAHPLVRGEEPGNPARHGAAEQDPGEGCAVHARAGAKRAA